MILFVLFDLYSLPHPAWFNFADPLAAAIGLYLGYRTLPVPLEKPEA